MFLEQGLKSYRNCNEPYPICLVDAFQAAQVTGGQVLPPLTPGFTRFVDAFRALQIHFVTISLTVVKSCKTL